MTLERLDELRDEFHANDDMEKNEETFNALIEGYKEHFGDKWNDVKHILLNHMSADLYDCIYEAIDNGEKL